MISSRPPLCGTDTFRPMALGFRPRSTTANRFRPLVAGQYLRMPYDTVPAEFTFLNPFISDSSVYRFSVNVSPRVIWQVMSRTSAGSPTLPANSRQPEQPCAGNQRSASPSSLAAPPRMTAVGLDRLKMLQEVTQQLAAASVPGDRDDFRTHDALPSPSTPQLMQEFAPLLFTFRNVTEHAGDHAAAGDSSGFQPTVCRLWQHSSTLTGADHTTMEPHAHAPGTPWHGFTPRSFTFQKEWLTSGQYVSPAMAHSDGETRVPGLLQQVSQNRTFLVSPLVRLVAEHFATDFSPPGHEGHATQPQVRAKVTAPVAFGSMAAVGVLRPVSLVPAIYRKKTPADSSSYAGADAPTPLDGAVLADAFTSSLASRHVRSESAAPVPAAMSVVARPPLPAGVPSPRQLPTAPAAMTAGPVPPHASSPAGLPHHLMQQLTEQVVKALDARTLAARERLGRF